MNRGALRASCILLFALLGVLPAAAIPPTKAQQAAIAALPDAYRAWLEEVEIILTDEERTTFLALAKDYQRDAFIERFWAVRDTVKRTARNEFRDAWEASLQQAKAMFGGVKDGRTRAMLLNGIPDERVESNCSLILVPTEVWFYGPSQHFREGHVVVLYRKWAAGPFRLWEPAEEIDVLFTGESGPLGDQHSLGEIASPGDKGCGDDEHARRVLAGIAWVLGQAADWIYVQQMIDQPPKPPGAEWVSAFNSYSTDIPAGAPPLPAKLDLAFPGRMQSRTVVRGVVTVPPGAAAQARLGEARSYNLLLNGEVLANGELLDSFRYKFDLSAAEASADAAPLTGRTAAAQAAGFYCGYDNRTTPPTISRGSKGDTVREAQCLLVSLGYSVGGSGIDGDFGQNTEKAVKAFQKDYGISGGADGIVGKNTWYGLRNY